MARFLVRNREGGGFCTEIFEDCGSGIRFQSSQQEKELSPQAVKKMRVKAAKKRAAKVLSAQGVRYRRKTLRKQKGRRF